MSQKKILVVDDNEIILKTLSLKLKSGGYLVFTATDGAGAVGVARREKPDLILLDIGFPPEVSGVPWDGFRIIEWLKRINEAKNTPIIVITGSQATEYKDRAMAMGAVGFHLKPVNNEQLLSEIGKLLGAEAPQAVKS